MIRIAAIFLLAWPALAQPLQLAPRDQPRPAPCADCPRDRPLCRSIATCGDAYRLLQHCGFERLDADQDGIPCERLLCGADARPPAVTAVPACPRV